MIRIEKLNIEAVIHLLFWLFIFSAVNVHWTTDWFDKTIRPNTPAPLSALIFPVMFYAHALWAIPKFLNREKWQLYLLSFLLIFMVPEFLRSALLAFFREEVAFWAELTSRDSLLFGEPNVFWLALSFSFAYRFSKDWFIRQRQIEKLDKQLSKRSRRKKKDVQPLEPTEAQELQQQLEDALLESQAYLNPKLSLAELARLGGTTNKKLSTLLNQNMHTNFYDFINSYRIAAFKKAVREGKLEQLSILGLAYQCGFKSKSSFYRAFKKETGMSPSAFIP